MNLRSDWVSDTRYRLGLGGGVAKVPRTECYYWFVDALNPTINVNSDNQLGTANRFFFCSSMGSMLALYQEAVIRNSVLNIEATADYQKVIADNALPTNYDSASDPTIHFACAQVPLSYLRNSADALHTIANAGTLYNGVDYYSSLTQSMRAKALLLVGGLVLVNPIELVSQLMGLPTMEFNRRLLATLLGIQPLTLQRSP